MEERKELVFVPAPGMGHLLSTAEVAKVIVDRHPRFSVVILVVNASYDAVNSYVDSKSRDSDPNGRLVFIKLPPPSTLPDPTSRNFLPTLLQLHKPIVKQAVLDRVQSGSPEPAGFVLDMFCATMIDVADQLNLPTYFFFTSGASLLNLLFLHQSMADNEGVNIPDECSHPDKEMKVPGFRNGVPGKVVPSVCFDKEGGLDLILNIVRSFRKSKGIIVNSYFELESYGIQALLEQANEGKIPPVYPVGPLLELDNVIRGSHKEHHHAIIEWLDNQPVSSVAFLCFGSMGSFNEEQVKEIARGLESSGHRFLWSLRKPPSPGKPGPPSQHETFLEALPEGFLERTGDRGKVIGWAPQVAILAHPSVGGFVSHCGWNSTLESLWFGVPMAAWPQYAEQQLNAFMLVKELEIAVEIRMDYRTEWRTKVPNFTVTAEEVDKGVKKLMSMDEKHRQRVKEMGDKGRNAMGEGGSSYNSLARFLQHVLHNVE